MNPVLLRTVGTTVENAVGFHPMTDNTAATVGAGGRQSVDCALETIKYMGCVADTDFKAFVVYVATYFTPHPIFPHRIFSFVHCSPLSSITFSRCLRFLDVLTSCPRLSSRWFGALRHITSWLGFEAVSADLHGLRAQFPEQIFRILCIANQLTLLHVSILLANQPLDRGPGASRAFP